jgi:hypothetical protein
MILKIQIAPIIKQQENHIKMLIPNSLMQTGTPLKIGRIGIPPTLQQLAHQVQIAIANRPPNHISPTLTHPINILIHHNIGFLQDRRVVVFLD